ncbi:2OG-Fe(II) oxygenase [Fulvivirga maritima]
MTNFWLVKGSRAYYRVTIKQGVSGLVSGEKFVMAVIFHDAVS